MIKGRIHSIESMGLVDGPGIRTVIFFQGCTLRCAYCHNPDTWSFNGGSEISAKELLNEILRYKPYFKKSNGGVTCSGGEPLMQEEFLLEFLKLCKENNINTAIDTAGVGRGDYDTLLKYVDLVILDLKHYSSKEYKHITLKDIDKVNEFIESCNNSKAKVWIRHVVVPEITDSKKHMMELRKVINNIKNLEKVELLPYHTLGVNKYEKLKIDYRLKGIKDMDKDKCRVLQYYLDSL